MADSDYEARFTTIEQRLADNVLAVEKLSAAVRQSHEEAKTVADNITKLEQDAAKMRATLHDINDAGQNMASQMQELRISNEKQLALLLKIEPQVQNHAKRFSAFDKIVMGIVIGAATAFGGLVVHWGQDKDSEQLQRIENKVNDIEVEAK